MSGQFYEGFNTEGKEFVLPHGVYTIDDLKQYGSDRNWCPYFLARYAVIYFFDLINYVVYTIHEFDEDFFR